MARKKPPFLCTMGTLRTEMSQNTAKIPLFMRLIPD
jgi:hypothetical protein